MTVPTAASHSAGVPVPDLPAGLQTPCLVVDLDVVDRNARRLQDELDRRGVRLRPHVKTHKSVALGRLQLESGAAGLTVGTLGEAEVMAAAGLNDLFLAYPLWAEGAKAARLRALHESIGLIVGVDSRAGAERLAAAVAGTKRPLRVVIELDSGGHRTGAGNPGEAVAVALAAQKLDLHVLGVFTHGGHSYAGPDAGAPAAADEVRSLGQAADALSAAEIPVEVVSAGSTPTAVDAATGQVNEIRAGTYLLGDRQQVALGSISPDGIALHVAATVVSTTVPGQVILDAGAKCLTKDLPPYLDGHGLLPAYPEAFIERLYDYHGATRIPDGQAAPALGEIVAIVPNHVCPVVDLFDSFVAVRGGEIVGRWPVDARGRSG
ncbi:MAG TPA: alanine racemase [Candidatus Limnocylindria bacterium]|nr:alanine racemase [Candidatus Limnocylindria bacterium]